MREIGVGLLGYGLAGAHFHAPLISATPGLRLAAIATSRDVPEHPDAFVDSDPRAVIAHPEVGIVVVATPNDTHRPLAEAALAAGRHAVVDKPFALDVAEADAMIAAARAANRMLTVFQNRRWDGDYLTVKRLIDDGRLGRLSLVEMHWDRFRPAIKPGWREHAGPGSGVTDDLGAHMIDQTLCLFGPPDAVSADIAVQRIGAVADDYFRIALTYPGHEVALSASALVARPRPRFALYGDRGAFAKYGVDVQEERLRAGISPITVGFGSESADAFGRFVDAEGIAVPVETLPGNYLDFYARLVRAADAGAPPPVDPLDARRVMRVLALARESAARGRRLDFTD